MSSTTTMLANTVTVVLLAFMLQAEALPAKNQENSSVKKFISKQLDVYNAETLISLIGEHSDIIEELIPSVASVMYRMATCKTDTTDMALLHIDDVMACINITLSLYDIEIVLYHAFQLGLEVYDNAISLDSDILECRNGSSNVVHLIECAITAVENSYSVFEAFLNQTSELVLEIVNNYRGLTENIEKCVEFSSTTVVAARHLMSSVS